MSQDLGSRYPEDRAVTMSQDLGSNSVPSSIKLCKYCKLLLKMIWTGLVFGLSTLLFILIVLALVGGTALYTRQEQNDPGTRKCLHWFSIFVGIIVLLYIIPVSLTISSLCKLH